MNYDKIIYRIIKLDKSVYLDLISVPESLQRALAIWVASATISLLAILSLFTATVDYVAEELPFYTQMLVQSGASEEDISSFYEAIGFFAFLADKEWEKDEEKAARYILASANYATIYDTVCNQK